MRKWLFLGLIVSLGWASGCATVTRTAAENRANYRSICELDMLEMADDWNLIWLGERQCRLTKWHTR